MGKVFLANDASLDRVVAIKFLHSEYNRHSEAIKRFAREAKAASALNHPNIITIYEIGEWNGLGFIAMEYVEGHSLRDFIETGKLRLQETLDIVIQAAAALGAAHEKGIVHRDIKPENIMRRPDKLVKVLDFGLAKQVSGPKHNRRSDSEATTRGMVTTEPGFVIGTAAYMSPEQARGKPTDARTDIWSLGVVLFEMITGELPFPGETKSDMVASILRSEPRPLSFSSSELAHEFEHIFKKAFGKDRDERYQVVKDLILDLKILKSELTTEMSEHELSERNETSRLPVATQDEGYRQTAGLRLDHSIMWYLIPFLAVVGLVAGLFIWRSGRDTAIAGVQPLTSVQLASWKSDLGEGDPGRPRLSPDGKLIAYSASKEGRSSIWLKQINGGEPFTQKQGDSVDLSPVWSPDGGQIAYFSNRGGRSGIWSAPALGGEPILLAALSSRATLIHWSRDASTIYFELLQNLYALNIGKKEFEKLTDFDTSQIMFRDINVSPDEKRIAYVDRQDEQSDIWIADLNGKNPERITDDEAEELSPIWHPDGMRIIYNSFRNQTKQIWVVFVETKRQVQLGINDTDSVSDISSDGTKLLYTTMKDDADLWGIPIDGGKEFQVTSDLGVEFWPEVSPNGEVVVYQAIRQLSTGGNVLECIILSQGLRREVRATQIAADGFYPRWSPDGGNIAFLRAEAGRNRLWVTTINGVVTRPVSESAVMFGGYSLLPYNRLQPHDYQWAPDGRSLVYAATRDGISNIWQAFADGTGEKQISNNVVKNLLFFNPVYSPDGNSIAWSGMTTDGPDNRKWSIWLLSAGNITEVIQANNVTQLIGWSSAQRLFLRSMEGKKEAVALPAEVTIQVFDTNTGIQKVFAKLASSYFQSPTISANGETIAYISRLPTRDSVKTIATSNAASETLVESNDNRVYFSSVVFAPDGKTLFFGKQANWQVISMVNNFE